MSETVTRILSSFSDAFFADQIELITAHFAYPLPVYCEGELIVFGSADTFAEGLRLYRDAVTAIGTTHMRPRVVAQGLPVRGYSNIWVEWDHLDANGSCLRSNQVRYATHQSAHSLFPCIEMVDYTVTAFPELHETLPAARTA